MKFTALLRIMLPMITYGVNMPYLFLTKLNVLLLFFLINTVLFCPTVLYARSSLANNDEKSFEKTSTHLNDNFLNKDSNSENTQLLYKLELLGIKNADAKKNAQIYLSMISPQEMDGSPRNFSLVQQAIQKAISVYGYFNSTIKFDLIAPKKRGNKGKLRVTVEQGPPTYIAGTRVDILGQAQKEDEFKTLLTKIPAIGTQVNQETYDKFKENLQQLGIERGYFDANFTLSRLDVKPSTHQAWWNIDYDSGQRYRFGHFTFENSQIRQDYLQNIMHMKEGSPYNMQNLIDLNNDLSASGWFKTVLIQPKIDKENKTVDVNVSFYPQKKNLFKVGVGYATDVGGRLQLGWNKPWINSKGQSFHSGFYISRPKIVVETAYRIPLVRNPLKYFYEIFYGIKREDENDTFTNSQALSVMRYWNRETGWQNGVGLRVLYDSFTQASQSHKTLLVYPTVTAIRTRFRGGLFPYWGDTKRISLGVGNKVWGSEVNFYRLQASTVWIRTYFDKHRFISRAGVGYLHTNQFDRIPPNLRFFLGGDNTIRGYKYETVAPRDAAGKLIGGAFMGYAGLEYNYQVLPNWWGAVFADTGFSTEKFIPKDLCYGAGVGVRWISPVGPVKLDVATPVRSDHHNVQFYLSLGTEL